MQVVMKIPSSDMKKRAVTASLYNDVEISNSEL